MGGRIWRVIKNELRFFIHDRRSIVLFVFGPILVIALFGAAASNEVTLSVAVVNEGSGQFSSRLVQRFVEQKKAEVKQSSSLDEAKRMLNGGQVDAVILIPTDFDLKLSSIDSVELVSLIEQEMSAEPSVPIPEPVLDILRLWRPTPLVRAVRFEEILKLSDDNAEAYFALGVCYSQMSRQEEAVVSLKSIEDAAKDVPSLL
jgi:acyl carrier protein